MFFIICEVYFLSRTSVYSTSTKRLTFYWSILHFTERISGVKSFQSTREDQCNHHCFNSLGCLHIVKGFRQVAVGRKCATCSLLFARLQRILQLSKHRLNITNVSTIFFFQGFISVLGEMSKCSHSFDLMSLLISISMQMFICVLNSLCLIEFLWQSVSVCPGKGELLSA